MQYLNIIYRTRDLGRRAVQASSILTKGLGSRFIKGSDVRARATDLDAWYRTNVGARYQSDFWLNMFVKRGN